jgi:hypothetical protein
MFQESGVVGRYEQKVRQTGNAGLKCGAPHSNLTDGTTDERQRSLDALHSERHHISSQWFPQGVQRLLSGTVCSELKGQWGEPRKCSLNLRVRQVEVR